MPQAIIFLEEGENKKVEKYSKLWDLSKQETIKKMVREFGVEE